MENCTPSCLVVDLKWRPTTNDLCWPCIRPLLISRWQVSVVQRHKESTGKETLLSDLFLNEPQQVQDKLSIDFSSKGQSKWKTLSAAAFCAKNLGRAGMHIPKDTAPPVVIIWCILIHTYRGPLLAFTPALLLQFHISFTWHATGQILKLKIAYKQQRYEPLLLYSGHVFHYYADNTGYHNYVSRYIKMLPFSMVIGSMPFLA